jgi:tetratricopeptide (TPR) repeat protein
MHLSLLGECRDRAEQALAAALQPRANRDARREMKLRVALAVSLRYTRGAVPETGVTLTKALEAAESLGDPEYQLQALCGLCFFHTASGQHRIALELAQRLSIVAMRRPDPNDQLIGEQVMGTSRHFLGDQISARRHIERVLANYVTPEDKPYLIRFQVDIGVMARLVFARILWLQGLSDQAMLAARKSVEDARAANHPISLCYALYMTACPIALLVGDLVAAEHYVEMLLDHSKKFALTWLAWGRCYQAALVIKRGDVAAGLRQMRAGFEELGDARSATLPFIELFTLEALGRAGQITDGLAAVDQAIAQCERTEERWAMAEMLRVKGELLLLQGVPAAAAAAEEHFRQALNEARRWGALSWELRAATSLARWLRDQGRIAEARDLLAQVYERFTEGFDTADLVAAKGLLQELRTESP